jgi:hypothetical protein
MITDLCELFRLLTAVPIFLVAVMSLSFNSLRPTQTSKLSAHSDTLMEDDTHDTLYISSNTFTFLHKEFWHSFVLYELYIGLSC